MSYFYFKNGNGTPHIISSSPNLVMSLPGSGRLSSFSTKINISVFWSLPQKVFARLKQGGMDDLPKFESRVENPATRQR